MTNGGLLRDPSRIWTDAEFRRSIVIQASTLCVILVLSAYYHFILKRPTDAKGQAIVHGGAGDTAGVKDEEIAEIDSLIVYPLKGGRGIDLIDAQVSRKGFKYDRRWAVIKQDGLKRLTLKDEPLITLIIPSFDTAMDGQEILRLHISSQSKLALPDIGIPLEPAEAVMNTWPLVEGIKFYGDEASGRQVQLSNQDGEWQWTESPSEWVSRLLGYPVYLVQFDASLSKRDTFPIFRPPHDLSSWSKEKQTELASSTRIEFQDIYPFLIATRESLAAVNQHIRTALAEKTYRVDEQFWRTKQSENDIDLPIQQFRPNIVLRSRRRRDDEPEQARYAAFSEDSWETIWIKSKDTSATLPVHLVARCERCLLTTVDPQTAHREPNVPLVYLRKTRLRDPRPGHNYRKGPCFGMYSIPEQVDGQYMGISVGDHVRVRWRPYSLDDEVTLGTRSIKGQQDPMAD